MAIAVNKIFGIYAACACDIHSVEWARESNNVTTLTLGRHIVGPEFTRMLVSAFPRSVSRVDVLPRK
ncbi:MAG: RpiB/LacA/LacB family sugar-phosphate isomerase [Atribacterota bacterium]